MDSIGDFFRQVRETKGLTVDEVASKTRIRADFVRAIEEGNYARLPDQVFARGFVRSYARSLGLDEEDALQRFVQSAGSYYDRQNERERLKQKQEEEDRRRRDEVLGRLDRHDPDPIDREQHEDHPRDEDGPPHEVAAAAEPVHRTARGMIRRTRPSERTVTRIRNSQLPAAAWAILNCGKTCWYR